MTEADRRAREFPRYEVSAYVDYTGTEVLLYHRIQNISLGGVCIQTPSIEEVGSILRKRGIPSAPDGHRRVLAVIAYLRAAPEE